jgi:uroporphyrinogen decarboxylase
VNGVGVDQMTDITSLTLPSHVARQGNLDPVLLLQGGDAMRTEAKRVVQAMTGKPFIFNLGHGVMQPTPPEHVADLVAAVRNA